MRRPSRWSPETKARAVALCGEVGAAKASAETGVPVGTVRSWVHRTVTDANAAAEYAPARDVVPHVRTQPWPARRPAVVQNLAEALDEVLVAARTAVGEGRLRDAQAGFVSVGILVDKVSLLSGDATSRHEQHHLTSPGDRQLVLNEIDALERELDEMRSLP
jgi:transposase-like protein